ncbi:MAG: 50S ribosomal protein L3 [Candidatus Omnitrophica bacterium]|nr:50S ribosomal protein L3 [Candidatus Omnitrophota bacterium]
MASILGKKIGMTNVFDEEGYFIPVTIIEAGPCYILGIKTVDKDGYSAVVLGYGEKKPKQVKKPEKGWFDKLKITPKKVVREIRLANGAGYKVGDALNVNIFKNGDYIDVSGTTIGKGFQGGVKRWHWRGGDGSHGSMFHRAPGSIGASSYPSRVHKGKTLPGHMGNVKRTIQNLKLVGVDPEKNLLIVKGSVPGHKGSLLTVSHAKKRPPKDAKVK